MLEGLHKPVYNKNLKQVKSTLSVSNKHCAYIQRENLVFKKTLSMCDLKSNFHQKTGSVYSEV